MAAPRFQSEEAHHNWLDEIGFLAQISRLGVQDYPTLAEAAVAGSRSELAERYFDKPDKTFVGAEISSSKVSSRNAHLCWVDVTVTVTAQSVRESVIDDSMEEFMSFAIYQLSPAKFLVLDHFRRGQDWSYWEDKFTPNIGLVRAQFRLYDIDGDGTITQKELTQVLQRISADHWTKEKIKRLMANLDTNHDGRIDFGEFIEWIFSVNGYSQRSFLDAAEDAVKHMQK